MISDSSRLRSLTLAGLGALCALSPASSALANDSTYTRQASAINAEFLRDLPTPEDGGAAICIVDTGVTVTPDLEDAVIARYALDGGSVDDLSSTGHGTRVAQAAVGAVNGWGSAGIWPGGKVISVRATTSDDYDSFRSDRYIPAILACSEAADDLDVPLATINLSLGELDTSSAEFSALEERITYTRNTIGSSVVASAGNDANTTTVNYPARFEDAIAVGASDTTDGSFCSFSNRGDGLDISAPGCNLDVADASGLLVDTRSTSQAAPVVSAVLAALRSYAPELSVEEAETLLLDNAQTTSAGLVVDAEATFRAAGLGELVDTYAPAESAEEIGTTVGNGSNSSSSDASSAGGDTDTATTSDMTSSDSTSTSTVTTGTSATSSGHFAGSSLGVESTRRPPRPQVRSVRIRSGRLVIVLATVRRGATLEIKIDGHRYHITHPRRRFSLPLKTNRWRSVRLRWYLKGRGYSRWRVVKRPGRHLVL